MPRKKPIPRAGGARDGSKSIGDKEHIPLSTAVAAPQGREVPCNVYAQLEAAMQARDLAVPQGLIAGKWQRCDATNKLNGRDDGSYLLVLDEPRPWAIFTNWTDGKGYQHWHGEAQRPLTETERQEFEQRLKQARAEADKIAAEMAERARLEAQRIWDAALPAGESQFYLANKDIQAHGTRDDGDQWHCGRLLVPMCDPECRLVNLQYIANDGRKWFLKGGRAKGCFSKIPGNPELVVVCEGFSTGASINEATDALVAIAFGEGNLAEVAAMIRRELNSAESFIWKEHDAADATSGLQRAERPGFLNTKLVIAADNDKNKVGLHAGLKAGRAAKALVVLPVVSGDGTDFNDMVASSGSEAVDDTIKNKAIQWFELLERTLLRDKESGHEAQDPLMIEHLHNLQSDDPVFYEKLLGKLKDRKVRVGLIDKAVKKAAIKAQPDEAPSYLYPHWEVEPWAEAVDTTDLMRDIETIINNHVATLGVRSIVPALWIMFTWVHDIATHSPMLLVTSPEADCGKSTLLGIVGFLARCALSCVGINPAPLYRSIEKWHPTLIVDEADTALADNPDLKAVVNSGWTRGTGVIRCDPETNEPRLYSTFSPKAIGMVGKKMHHTTLSRNIVVELKRKGFNESVLDFNHLDNNELATLRQKLARWSADNTEALLTVTPEIPAGFHNRKRMNWWLLFAIAELAGDDAKRRLTQAALEIEGTKPNDQQSIGVQLLVDIRGIFDASPDEFTRGILSQTLIEKLVLIEEAPWREYWRGKPLTPKQLAGMLRSYGIISQTVHPPDEAPRKGYRREHFKEAWSRYAPNPPSQPTIRPNADGTGVSSIFPPDRDTSSGRLENDELSHSRSDLVGRSAENGDSSHTESASGKKPLKKAFGYRIDRAARMRFAREAQEAYARRQRAKNNSKDKR